jgi:hypothetical protein
MYALVGMDGVSTTLNVLGEGHCKIVVMDCDRTDFSVHGDERFFVFAFMSRGRLVLYDSHQRQTSTTTDLDH